MGKNDCSQDPYFYIRKTRTGALVADASPSDNVFCHKVSLQINVFYLRYTLGWFKLYFSAVSNNRSFMEHIIL